MKVLILLLLALLLSCATTRQRVIVINVHENALSSDSLSVARVDSLKYEEQVRLQEKRKNFWRNTTFALVLILFFDIVWR